MNGIPLNNSLNIEWVNENLVADNCEINNECRLNVPAYIKDESGRYTKDSNGNYIKEEISKEQFELLPEGFKSQYFLYSGKRYKKCDRPWRFYMKQL